MSDKPIAAGKSSYDMIDTAAFWPALNLEKGSVMGWGGGGGRGGAGGRGGGGWIMQ